MNKNIFFFTCTFHVDQQVSLEESTNKCEMNSQDWLKTQTYDLGLATTLFTSTIGVISKEAEWNHSEWLQTQTFDFEYHTLETRASSVSHYDCESTTTTDFIPKSTGDIDNENFHLGDHCKDGNFKCHFDGSLDKCDHGKWVNFQCAAGTTCSTTFSDGQMVTGCNAVPE